MLKSYPTGAAPTGAETDSFDMVVADPAAFYPDPAAIVADTGLSRQQRLRLLTEWAQDLVDRQVAENEGMAPEGIVGSAHDTGLLRQVNTAIEAVEVSPETPPGLIARVWRRMTVG